MNNIMTVATRWMLYLLAIVVISYFVFPGGKAILLGLALGLLASTMNGFLLFRRVIMVTNSVAEEETKRRRRGLGFANRIAVVLLLAMFGYKYPDIINLPAAISASMVMPFVILVAAIVHTVKENRSGKG